MGIVWDSDRGRTCPLCARELSKCNCQRAPAQDPGDGIVRLRIEKQGRKGKTVTVVAGLPFDQLKALCKALKKRCGSGGAVKDSDVELQGDHRDAIRKELAGRGFTVKG